MKTILISEVRARESDPKMPLGAQARIQELIAKLDPFKKEIEKLIKSASQETTARRKLKKVRELIDLLNTSLSGISACQSGCSHCCHIPVLMTQTEANIISEEIQVKAEMPAYSLSTKMSEVGVPCTFLKDNKCSIYDSRPIACRLCHNMDEDSILCNLFPGEQINVPYFDGHRYEHLWLQSIGANAAAQIANLSDFFPNIDVNRE